MRENNTIKTIREILLALIIGSTLAAAQHGSASSGYFPPGYVGDTWSGTVNAVNPDTREIVLTYKGKNKEETFTGVLQPGYKRTTVDGKSLEVDMTKIPIGSYMVVYYIPKSKKVDSQKTKYYEIFHFDWYPTKPK
jgi:hypothetical protein